MVIYCVQTTGGVRGGVGGLGGGAKRREYVLPSLLLRCVCVCVCVKSFIIFSNVSFNGVSPNIYLTVQ